MKPRVLFVDDQPEVLTGLQRVLRGYRDRWQMHFAPGGREALAHLETTGCDILVTDMRMPGMDGAQLLRTVREKFPGVVRFVLSGEADQARVLNSVDACHQYLSKPCDASEICAAITRALSLRQLISSDSLRELVSRIGALPSLPHLYRAVVRELSAPGASLRRVSDLIAQDMGMTVKVLQLVNSSYFGLARRVDSVAQAVSLLGLSLIKPLVLSAGIFSQLPAARLNGFSFDQLVDHGVAVSRLAGQLAERRGSCQQTVDEALTAGMIHDVGQLLLAVNLPEEYAQARQFARQHELPLADAERECLGASHADVGAYLLGSWGLPHAIVEAVAYHHEPGASTAEQFSPLAAVHVANVLLSRQAPSSDCSRNLEFDAGYLARIGWSDALALVEHDPTGNSSTWTSTTS